MTKHRKTCRGKHRNSWENMETHGDTQRNRKTGKKKAGRENMVKLKKKGGYIRKHRNKWEYRESIGEQVDNNNK